MYGIAAKLQTWAQKVALVLLLCQFLPVPGLRQEADGQFFFGVWIMAGSQVKKNKSR